MVPCMLVWNDSIILSSFGGHPILCNSWNRPFLLTRSNAFVRSIKAMYKGMFCSLHFSCSCLTEKIMSTVDLCDLNPHWDSGYMRSASFWSRFRTTLANTFPVMLRSEIPLKLLQSLRSPLFLYRVAIFASLMSWGTVPSSQQSISSSWRRWIKVLSLPALMIYRY